MRRVGTIVMVFGLIATACGDDGGAGTTTTTATTIAPSTTATSEAATTTTTSVETTTTAAPSGGETWFDPLEIGTCFDDVFAGNEFDFSLPPAVVPCDGPHDNEVVALVDLPDGDYPGQDTLFENVNAGCAVAYDSFFGGSERAVDFVLTWNVVPDEADWEAGARVAACITYAGEPVRGTARSAGLTAPGEFLGVVHEVDGQLDIWVVDGGTGELVVNVSDDPSPVQTSPPGWNHVGQALFWAQGDSEPARRIWGATVGDDPVQFLEALDVDSVGTPAPNPVELLQIAVIAAPDGGEFDVFLYDADDDSLTNLTADNPDRDTSPNWSPDGTKLAYRARIEGNSDIWVMDADGSNKTRVTTDPAFDGDPRWSPDGTRLLFTSDRTGDFEIWVMDADGSNQQNLTNHPADDEYPTWSEDGSLIAFHSDRHGGITLWLMNSDGSGQSNLSWLGPVGYPTFRPYPPE